MRKTPLYSPPLADPRPRSPLADPRGPSVNQPPSPQPPAGSQAAQAWAWTAWRRWIPALGLLLVALALWNQRQAAWVPQPTQADIDAAVLHALSERVWPAPSVRAADNIRPSVVRVQALGQGPQGLESELGVGTGVVVLDHGVVLTNLHVVQGALRLRLLFADGSESDADLTGVRPEHDLAVLQARTVPDDLVAATLSSSHDLRPGDGVVVVGFPFGVGPSVSAGVVSGMGRSFQDPQGGQAMQDLIQFDAAANPGNSGGPLVTHSGEVVGIVTGILNPTNNRTFLGIGFAVPIEHAASAVGQPPF